MFKFIARLWLLPALWAKKPSRGLGWIALILLLGAGSSLMAETHSASVPESTASGEDSFGHYLVAHEADLEPFFSTHADDLVRSGLPLLLSFLGYVILLNLLVGWVFDFGLSYGFAKFFAPAYANIKQAIIYATGRLVLSVVIGLLAGVGAIALSAISPIFLILDLILFLVINFFAQAYWVTTVFRTGLGAACLFYLGLIVIHSVLGGLVSGPFIQAHANAVLTQYIDQNVTTQLKSATAEAKRTLAVAEAARDKVKAESTAAQDRFDQAKARQQLLTQEIVDMQNSEGIAFQRVVRVHAQGDLTGARDQFLAFLAKFPNGALQDQAKQQLAMINSELAVKEVEKQQAAVAAAISEAKARAALLARAEKGEVTLSEMREALIGKTRDDIKGLFGAPTESGPDRWGYGQEMIINPVTDERHGLTVYFQEGVVLSVDYYFGTGDTK